MNGYILTKIHTKKELTSRQLRVGIYSKSLVRAIHESPARTNDFVYAKNNVKTVNLAANGQSRTPVPTK